MNESLTDQHGLGRLRRVALRDVWKNEAQELTPWLHQNVDVLAAELGITITANQREVAVGDFRLDLLGEDDRGRPVIIENQLEATDHSHLGQLMVYAAGLEAGVVIWLTPQFRPEHRRALDWLNERTDEQVHFFGVELDAVCIANSPPAPMFRVIARPNDWQKAAKQQSIGRGGGEQQQGRRAFFQACIDAMASKRPNLRPPSPGTQNWFSLASGPFGYYALSFASAGRLRAEIYLDTGDRSSTKALFDALHSDRANFDAAFEEPLSWERLDNVRAARVAVYRPAPNLQNEEEAKQATAWAASRLLQFIEVFDERVRREARQLRNSRQHLTAQPSDEASDT